MLIYCFEPVGLSYEDAMPAFLRAIDNEQLRQTLFSGDQDQLRNPLGEIGSELTIGAVRVGNPTEEAGRVVIPIQCSTKDLSLISMVGEVTLSRLRPTLCHLSLTSSITGRLATGMMYNREFQMAVELAVAGFLDNLARAVIVLAPSGNGRRWGSYSA